MTLLRFILFFLFFYIIIKVIKRIIKIFTHPLKQDTKANVNTTGENKFDIKKEDIIEAEFEEIKDSQADKSKQY